MSEILNIDNSVNVSPVIISLPERLKEIKKDKCVLIRSKNGVFDEFSELRMIKKTLNYKITYELSGGCFGYYERHKGDFGVILRDTSSIVVSDKDLLKRCMSKISTKLGYAKFTFFIIVRNTEIKYFKVLASNINNFVMLEITKNDMVITNKEIDKIIDKLLEEQTSKKETKKEEIKVVEEENKNITISFDKSIKDVV